MGVEARETRWDREAHGQRDENGGAEEGEREEPCREEHEQGRDVGWMRRAVACLVAGPDVRAGRGRMLELGVVEEVSGGRRRPGGLGHDEERGSRSVGGLPAHDEPRPGLADGGHLTARSLDQRAIARPPANLGIDRGPVVTSHEDREGLGTAGMDAVGLVVRRTFAVSGASRSDLERRRAADAEVPRNGDIALQPRRAPARR